MGLHWAMNGPGSIAAWLVGRRQARARDQADAAPGEPDASDAEGGPSQGPEGPLR
jgi:hypothetical protein